MQTQMRLVSAPSTFARTRCRFGSQRPLGHVVGVADGRADAPVLPQISQCLANFPPWDDYFASEDSRILQGVNAVRKPI